jgi:hypothetical protein
LLASTSMLKVMSFLCSVLMSPLGNGMAVPHSSVSGLSFTGQVKDSR